ncbi:MAG: ABC transporter ATP-binding protein, partial [Armatimonadota bacterium]
GLALKDRTALRESLEAMYARFPILAEKRGVRGGSLSGGQRMLLAFARALVSRPRVLLLDEPSAGLAPLVVKEVFGLVKDLRAQGPAILLIEQAVRDALPLADQVTVLAQGEVQFQGAAEGLSEAKLAEAYLGVKL